MLRLKRRLQIPSTRSLPCGIDRITVSLKITATVSTGQSVAPGQIVTEENDAYCFAERHVSVGA